MLKILATDGLDKNATKQLTEAGFLVDIQFYPEEELKTVLKEYDCVVVRSATKLRIPVIDAVAGSRLKLMIRAGVGIDNIDYEHAQSKGIAVANTPSASSASVAELAVAHMFALARCLHQSNVTMKKGEWNKSQYTGIELAGKTLGLIGLGRIGMETAKRAEALGMNVIYNCILTGTGEDPICPYEYMSMDGVMEKADFISLHLPSLGKPILDDVAFAKMKDGVYIINTARGDLIDEEALLRALDSGKAAGAALDVFAEEPVKNVAVYHHPKISLTPHIGASTKEAQERVGAEVVKVIKEFFC